MSESLDDHDPIERDEPELPITTGKAEALFGTYTVLSPGVEIVLEGRPISAPVAD